MGVPEDVKVVMVDVVDVTDAEIDVVADVDQAVSIMDQIRAKMVQVVKGRIKYGWMQ